MGIALIRYDELIAFKQQHGHCNVPQRYEQNKPIGQWVKTPRTNCKSLRQGKPSLMTAERQAALEKIGFELGLDHDSLWQTRYDELIAFKQRDGHFNVRKSDAQNKPLVNWSTTQRTHYKSLHQGKPSCMTGERQAALEKIGFEWGLDNSSSWQIRYDELIAFK